MDTASVKNIEFENFDENGSGGLVFPQKKIDLLKDIQLDVSIRLGKISLPFGELFSLKENSILTTNLASDSPVDLLVEGSVVARGNLVVVESSYGIQITEVIEYK